MNIKDIKYVDIVSTSENENGEEYEVITSYKKEEENKFLRTYKTTDKTKMCKYCGSWNNTENDGHECEKEYATNADIIDEINAIQDENSIRIYINRILI